MTAKRKILTFVWLGLCFVLMSCKADVPQQTSADQPVSSNISTSDDAINLSPSQEENSTIPTESTSNIIISSSNSSSTLSEEDDDAYIIWASNILPFITPERQDKIQQCINEKGIDCKIRFITNDEDTGLAYKAWIEELPSNGTCPDIIPSGYWGHGVFDAENYVREKFFPLDTYLDSEEGRSLYEAFTENEWKCSTMDGSIYALPNRNDPPYSFILYIHVNDRYKEGFDRFFDGTYDSLKTIREFYADANLHISFNGIAMPTITGLLNCQRVHMATYKTDTGELVDLTRQPEARVFFQTLYEDFRDGIVRIDPALDARPSADDLVWCIYGLPEENIEGFSVYRFNMSRPTVKLSGLFGINSSSSKKEMAFKILSACYSDPKIASLLYWGREDPEGWIAHTNYLNSQSPDAIAGFYPKLTQEQISAIFDYYNDMNTLAARLKAVTNGGKLYANPEFPEYLEELFDHPPDYGDAINVMNEQLQEWIKNHSPT